MKILFFGDLVGKPGRRALAEAIPALREKHSPDAIFANIENSAHGFGVTPEIIEELQKVGVDYFTSGNHIWKNSKGIRLLEQNPEFLVVPENYVEDLPGRPFTKVHIAGHDVLIINLIGSVFMAGDIRSPFDAFDKIVAEHGKGAIVIVDFHAEATGEKRAMSWYIDGRASLLVGTHTHIQTSDEQILPKGLGYITDLGMSGATESSLGMDKNLVIQKVAQGMELHLEPPIKPKKVVASGIVVTIDPTSRKAVFIERVDHRISL